MNGPIKTYFYPYKAAQDQIIYRLKIDFDWPGIKREELTRLTLVQEKAQGLILGLALSVKRLMN